MDSLQSNNLSNLAILTGAFLFWRLSDLLETICQSKSNQLMHKTKYTREYFLAILRLQLENSDENHSICNGDAKRDEIMEGPSMQLCKLCCNQRGC